MESIYSSPGSQKFYTPFTLTSSRLERLCLVEWNNGRSYKALEVQYIDNPQNGRGVLVILNSLDGKVNVYFEPTLTMDARAYAIGNGLRDFMQTPFERARFEIGPYGADVDVAFVDSHGERVMIRIHEGGPRPPSQFALLAPLGESIQNPEWMPLFLLSKFGFVRRKNTHIEVRFGEETVQVTRLPFPVGGAPVYIARYCADPFIIFWNRQYEGPLEPLRIKDNEPLQNGEAAYDLVEREGHMEIKAMMVRNPRHTARITFDPPFPNAAGLADGARVEGTFTITGDPLHGRVDGGYSAARQGETVKLRLHPSGGWTPAEQGLMLRLIFNLGKPFRNWPKTYEWNAELTLGESVHMRSGWRRRGKRDQGFGIRDSGMGIR